MLNKSSNDLNKTFNKEKRFVRSRSRSQGNIPQSPKNTLSGRLNKTFYPKFITEFDSNKENKLNHSLKQQCSNKLPAKLKIIQLEEQLKKCEGQKQKLKKQVMKLKQQKQNSNDKTNRSNKHLSRDKKSNPKENKTSNNLKKLKRQIAQNKGNEPLSELQKLQQQNKLLKADNNRYKVAFIELQNRIKELKQKVQVSSRETQLQNTVVKLQTQIRQQEQENRKLDLRLNVFLAKEANFEQNNVCSGNEELESLKIRYTRLIIQHNQLKKEVKAIKPTPKPCFDKNKGKCEIPLESYEVSLSLSPDQREGKH